MSAHSPSRLLQATEKITVAFLHHVGQNPTPSERGRLDGPVFNLIEGSASRADDRAFLRLSR